MNTRASKRRTAGPGVSFFAFQDIVTAVVGIFILITIVLILELVQRTEAASEAYDSDAEPIAELIEQLESDVADLSRVLEDRARAEAESAEVNAFNRDTLLEQMRQRIQAANKRIAGMEAGAGELESRLSRAEQEHARLLRQAEDLSEQRGMIEDHRERLRVVEQKINALGTSGSRVFRDTVEDGRSVVLVSLRGGRIVLRDALSRSVQAFTGARRLDAMRDWLERTPLQQRQLFILVHPGGAADFRALQQSLAESRATFGYSVVGTGERIRMSFELESSQ